MAQPIAITSVRQAFTDAYIIDLAGELTSSVEATLLNTYQQASNDGARVVILNFSRLAYKNSSGIKLLVTLLTRSNDAGQHLFAAELNVDYQNIFQVTQLDQGIRVYPSEADALQAAHDLLDTTGAPRPTVTPRIASTQPAVVKRSTDNWAKPVERLNIAEIPDGALALNVQGRRLFGPLQGFGQLWLKTYRIGLCNNRLTPQEVIAAWKQNGAQTEAAAKALLSKRLRHHAQPSIPNGAGLIHSAGTKNNPPQTAPVPWAPRPHDTSGPRAKSFQGSATGRALPRRPPHQKSTGPGSWSSGQSALSARTFQQIGALNRRRFLPTECAGDCYR